MTTIKGLTARHPGAGQIMRVRARQKDRNRSKPLSNGSMPRRALGLSPLAGGSEAFIHIRQLETAGHGSVAEGARVKVRVSQGQKGPEVTEVIQVDTGAARVASTVERHPARVSKVVGETEESIGTVKMYKVDKGFGFVGQDGGGKDVFVHVTALARVGLTELAQGQRVRMKISQGQKGLEAQTIELLD